MVTTRPTSPPATIVLATTVRPFFSKWMDVLTDRVEADAITKIADLGCGTGRFSNSLAEQFQADVIGIDPSTKMLREALNRPGSERVFYVGGTAEALPLPDESVDLIFISMVFHHFENPDSAVHSILIRLDHNEFNAGMKALRSFAAAATPQPITEPIDFVVFRKA